MRIDDDEIPSDLPDSARMQRVEVALQFQKRLIIALGAVSVILLSSFVTGALMLQDQPARPAAMGDPTTQAGADAGELRKRLASVEKDLESVRQERAAMTETLQRMQVIERTGQVEKLNAVLQEQERAVRRFMLNLKDGMFDLSRMVAGSRTWFDEYSQRLDRAIADGKAREARLQEISRLELPAETAAAEAAAPSGQTPSNQTPSNQTPSNQTPSD